jgi:hypothetical protein
MIKIPAMFVLMAIDAEILPVAAVGGIVVVIVVLVVNREKMKIPVGEFPPATGAYPGMYLQGLLTIGILPIGLGPARL